MLIDPPNTPKMSVFDQVSPTGVGTTIPKKGTEGLFFDQFKNNGEDQPDPLFYITLVYTNGAIGAKTLN